MFKKRLNRRGEFKAECALFLAMLTEQVSVTAGYAATAQFSGLADT